MGIVDKLGDPSHTFSYFHTHPRLATCCPADFISATSHACGLLQESKLLSGLVNKLGDPSCKIAFKAGYLLANLLEAQPLTRVLFRRRASSCQGW